MADWSYYEAFRNRPGSQASLLRGIGAKLKACSAKNSGTKAEFNAPPVVFKRGRPPLARHYQMRRPRPLRRLKERGCRSNGSSSAFTRQHTDGDRGS